MGNFLPSLFLNIRDLLDGSLWFLHLHPKEPIITLILSHAFVRSAHLFQMLWGPGAVLLIPENHPSGEPQ